MTRIASLRSGAVARRPQQARERGRRRAPCCVGVRQRFRAAGRKTPANGHERPRRIPATARGQRVGLVGCGLRHQHHRAGALRILAVVVAADGGVVVRGYRDGGFATRRGSNGLRLARRNLAGDLLRGARFTVSMSSATLTADALHVHRALSVRELSPCDVRVRMRGKRSLVRMRGRLVVQVVGQAVSGSVSRVIDGVVACSTARCGVRMRMGMRGPACFVRMRSRLVVPIARPAVFVHPQRLQGNVLLSRLTRNGHRLRPNGRCGRNHRMRPGAQYAHRLRHHLRRRPRCVRLVAMRRHPGRQERHAERMQRQEQRQ